MKKIVGISLLFIGIFTNTFSQRIVMDMNIPKLEKDVISDIRIYESYGQISDNTELLATTILEWVDTAKQNGKNALFDINQTIDNYLDKIQTLGCEYEIFVYDSSLKLIYINNRVTWEVGSDKKEPDKIDRENYLIAQFLLKGNYDFVYAISEKKFNYAIILLCFKNGLRDLAYLKDGQWYSTPVCGSDDFSFLKPLLEDKLKEREIIRERVKK